MVDIIRLVLPYLLLLYLVIKGIKSPLFFLGIPFLIFMSESVFLSEIKVFFVPGRLLLILGFIWLFLFWLFFSVVRIYNKTPRESNTSDFNVLDFCILGLTILTFIGLGTTLVRYSNINGVIKEFLNLISLFAGFFIIRNWTSYFKPEDLEKFIFSILIVNSIASCLYILHQGLHVRIYLIEEYLTEMFNGQQITRTFWFMPQFLFISIAYCLINIKKQPVLFIGLLIINLLATFITYFRSFTVIAVTLFILYSLLTGLKEGRIGLVIKNILIYSVVIIVFLFVLSKAFPSNTNYLMDRFSEITTPQLVKKTNNLDVRFSMSGFIISSIDDKDKIIGLGSVTENQLTWVRLMKQAMADMVWTEVIFRWGFVGLILFILLYVFAVIKAFTLFMKSEGVISELALLFLLYLFSQIAESFIDWTFMSEHGFAIGLWYFAMLSVVLGYKSDKPLLSAEKSLRVSE